MKIDRIKSKYYKESQYSTDQPFLDLIHNNIYQSSKILDAGAGAGELFKYDIKSKVSEVVGVDLDTRVLTNPQLHRGVLTDLTNMPFENDYFNIIISRYTFEHIQEPKAFLTELRRILRPGGKIIFLTPNKWHYVALIARFTPHKFHQWFNRLRGRTEEDTFSTIYKLNSFSDLR
ncbi:MAG: class I SAM-dependent methyltransferase, partial [Syntrophaceae bacterium]|nr:class I SAM-dependent methyltransferase [Syntrophaceae bacterium]